MDRDGDIWGKHALVRPTRESFLKALQEYRDFMREAIASTAHLPDTINPFIFLERAVAKSEECASFVTTSPQLEE